MDTLTKDVESLEHILDILNSDSMLGWRDVHPEPFTTAVVLPALERLVQDRLVEACQFAPEQNALVGIGLGQIPATDEWGDTWFVLTRGGRAILDAWEPPPLPGPSPDQQAST